VSTQLDVRPVDADTDRPRLLHASCAFCDVRMSLCGRRLRAIFRVPPPGHDWCVVCVDLIPGHVHRG
jgi:hypothetical protein